MEIGLLVLRVLLGAIIAAHGAQKLFGWFGGYGIAGTAGWLESLGFPAGRLQATVSGVAESGGGLLLAAGLLTPLGAAAIAGVMLTAIVAVHLPNGFFNTAGGYEFNLLIAGAAIALAITGPGELSLDHAFGWNLSGTEWGLAAVAAAVISSGLVLATRRSTEPVPTSVEETQAA